MGRLRTMTAILLAVGLASAGCSGDGDGDGDGDDGDAGPGGGSFADRLALLPGSLAEGDHGILVTMADLDAAAEAAGVTRPDDLTDSDALHAYLNAVEGIGTPGGPVPPVAALLPERIGPGGVAQAEEFEAELGWSVLDVSWFVEYPTPPVTLTVLGGEFAEDRLTGAMGAATDGRWRVGEGEDLSAAPDQRTAARPLGRPLTLALDSGRLFVSTARRPVDEAVGEAGATLAEVAELRALAEAMSTEGAYAAMLSAGGRYQVGPIPDGAGAPGGPDGADARLQPFGGVATGLVHDGEPFLVLAYAHADAVTAEANATALRALITDGRSLRTGGPWSELLAVADIRVEETTLVARLALGETHPGLAWQLLPQHDSLVGHQ